MTTQLFFKLLHEGRKVKEAGLDRAERHIYCRGYLAGLKKARNNYQEQQRKEIDMNDYSYLDEAADMRDE